MSMKIDILTLFPEMFAPLKVSMLGRAVEKGLIDVRLTDIRDFTKDKHNRTDDYPFGGGQGMVMMADPIFGTLQSVSAKNKKIIYMSPKGQILNQKKIRELSKLEEIVVLCGHYEGIDERIIDYWDIEEISIGDYILTGGEPAAIVLVDSIARMIPGVLSKEESVMEESIYSGLLEYPQYTQPRSYEGMDVPDVLLSGHHENIHLWKSEESLRITRKRRPDLFEKFLNSEIELSKKERLVLEKVLHEKSD